MTQNFIIFTKIYDVVYKSIYIFDTKVSMYLIIFELKTRDPLLKLKINRMLKKVGARKLQRGVWEHRNASNLIEIASFIKNFGGKARVFEENTVYE